MHLLLFRSRFSDIVFTAGPGIRIARGSPPQISEASRGISDRAVQDIINESGAPIEAGAGIRKVYKASKRIIVR